MSSWLVCLGFAALLQSAPAADVAPAAAQAIARAVSELGAVDFAVRERAARFLWEQARVAEPALERAANSADVEVRLQAHRILKDFRYGILPDVPVDMQTLIREFRDGGVRQRRAVLEKLAIRQRFDTLQRLLQLEVDPDVRRLLLVQLLETPQAIEKFIAGTALESLIGLVGADQDAAWRQATLAQVLFTPVVLRRLAEAGRLEELTKLIDGENDPGRRRELLAALFRNDEAVATLLDADQLEFVLQLVSKEPDKSHRGSWLCRVASSPEAAAALTAGRRLETLRDYADRNLDPQGRAALHSELIHAPATAAALLERHGLEGVLAQASAESNAENRGRLLAAWMGSPVVRKRLTDREYPRATLAVATKEKDAAARGEYLAALLRSRALPLNDARTLKSVWRLVRAEPSGAWRSDVVQPICDSSGWETLLETGDDVRWLLRLAHDGMNADQRYSFLDRLQSDAAGLSVFLRHGELPALLELARLVRADRRGRLLACLTSCRASVNYLYARQQITLLVSLARTETDAAARQGYLSVLFRSPPAMWCLMEAGQYEALETLILSIQDPMKQAVLFGDFLQTEGVVQEVIERKQESKLLEYAQQVPAPDAKREYLQRLFRSPSIARRLIDLGHFPALFALADQEADSASRTVLLAAFFANPAFVRQLAERRELAPLVRFVRQDGVADSRRPILELLGKDATAVHVLVETGQIEAILALCGQEKKGGDRALLLVELLRSPRVVQYFADRNQWDSYLDWLRRAHDADEQRRILPDFAVRPETLVPLVAGGRFEDFLGLFSREADEADRHRLVVAMLTESEPVRQLLAANQLERVVRWVGAEPQLEVRRELLNRLTFPRAAEQVLAKARLGAEVVAWIKAEPDPSHRSSAVQTTLYNPQVWHEFLSGGRPELLDELAALESDPEARREVRRYMLAAPSGSVAYHVERGEHPQALQLLEKNADHDLGRLHLATYLLATGRIEPRMAEVRRRLEQAPQASDARLLAYLARARGDSPAARQAAEQADDPGLLQAVLVEQRAWAEAAALQAAGPCPLPIPTREQAILKAGRRRAEQLNLLAAYQRLAGAERDFEQTVAQLKELAGENRRDPEVQWLCGVGLILNERWDDGLALVAGVHPLRAFDRLCGRHQYREALELAGWKSDTEASRHWLAGLPTTQADFRKPPEQRFLYALRVAALLRRLGDRQAAKQVLAVLTSYAREAPDGTVSPPNSGPWLDVLAGLMELGETELSWELGIGGSRFLTSSESLLRHIYEARFQKASAWWQLLSRSRPGEPERWTFQRARLGLDGPPPGDTGAFAELVAEAERHVPALLDYYQGQAWLAVADAYRRGSLPDRELSCLKSACQVRESPPEAPVKLADALRRHGRWAEAAEQFESVWQQDRERVGALYLSGEALQRAGREEEGRARRELALQIALDSRARLDLAGTLHTHGLDREALDQFRLALRTLPCGHPEWGAVAEAFGRCLSHDQPAEAAEWLQHDLLNNLRWESSLARDYGVLHAPSVIHRLRAVAAVRAGDFERADREIDLTLAAMPAALPLAVDLVPLLDQAGRQAQADRLFDRVFRALSVQLQHYPLSAMLHHELASLSARCRRRLEEALSHAQRAVELEPNNTAYQDTLAETQDQRPPR